MGPNNIAHCTNYKKTTWKCWSGYEKMTGRKVLPAETFQGHKLLIRVVQTSCKSFCYITYNDRSTYTYKYITVIQVQTNLDKSTIKE